MFEAVVITGTSCYVIVMTQDAYKIKRYQDHVGGRVKRPFCVFSMLENVAVKRQVPSVYEKW